MTLRARSSNERHDFKEQAGASGGQALHSIAPPLALPEKDSSILGAPTEESDELVRESFKDNNGVVA